MHAPGKAVITPVDENPLDLRLAFIAYVDSFWGGALGPGGRQEMAFDLQRFRLGSRWSERSGRPTDAGRGLDWEPPRQWQVIGFWSHAGSISPREHSLR